MKNKVTIYVYNPKGDLEYEKIAYNSLILEGRKKVAEMFAFGFASQLSAHISEKEYSNDLGNSKEMLFIKKKSSGINEESYTGNATEADIKINSIDQNNIQVTFETYYKNNDPEKISIKTTLLGIKLVGDANKQIDIVTTDKIIPYNYIDVGTIDLSSESHVKFKWDLKF